MKETPRIIKYGAEARKKIKEGIDAVADSVKVTLGPSGRNVILSREGQYAITKDGVSVATEIVLDDYFSNLGAQLIKAVSSNVASDVGDGTSTATVLSQYIYTHGLTLVESGFNQIELFNEMSEAANEISEMIDNISISVDSIDKVKHVATISANGDDEIGSLIANAVDTIGFDGIITVEESKTPYSYLDIVDGMRLDAGFVSPYFINDFENECAYYEDVNLLIYDGKIKSIRSLLPYLEVANSSKSAFHIMCNSVSPDVLQTLILNKVKGGMKIVVSKLPVAVSDKTEYLKDLAALTGSTVISEHEGIKLEDVDPREINNVLGKCFSSKVTSKHTTLIGSAESQESLQSRIQEIERKIELKKEAKEDYSELQMRLSKLKNGIAIIKVGAFSDVERKEKRDRIDDALSAVRAAIDGGIVPGGGVTLLRAAKKLENKYKNDIKPGYKILIAACKEPFYTIISNTGKNGEVIENSINIEDKFHGYDARKHEYVNMIENGIIDPANVTKSVVNNSVSNVGLLLTTDCVIVEKYKDKYKNK